MLTGYLGAGKTTLLRSLLADPGMARAAVVINEIGEVGIDHDLVTVKSENVSLLANGCICCTVRSDLQETLADLFARRRLGQVPDYDRVVVETTGLADPAPVVQTVATDPMLAAHYRFDGLVTLVDAVHGEHTIDREAEAVKQIALADRIVLTKTDLADPAAAAALEARIAAINPEAPVARAVMGAIDPSFVTGIGLAHSRADPERLRRFLGASVFEGSGDDGNDRYIGDAGVTRLGARHDAGVRTFTLRFAAPFTWPVFTGALELLAALRGPDLLRMKGIVNVGGAPVVVQGVQHIFSDPVHLDRWPSDDHGTRLVFITRRIERAAVAALFAAAAALEG